METEERITVLYNDCYGGFGMSQLALDKYNEKMKKIDPDFKEVKYDWQISRSDPYLVEVYNELGSEQFSGKYAKVTDCEIPKEYKNCYHIEDYDGKESVSIRYETYRLCKLKSIANDETMDDSSKIVQIKELLNNFKPNYFD
jgi:hypothetical protein